MCSDLRIRLTHMRHKVYREKTTSCIAFSTQVCFQYCIDRSPERKHDIGHNISWCSWCIHACTLYDIYFFLFCIYDRSFLLKTYAKSHSKSNPLSFSHVGDKCHLDDYVKLTLLGAGGMMWDITYMLRKTWQEVHKVHKKSCAVT